MNTPNLVEAMDRRATGAAAAMHDALVHHPIPELPPNQSERSSRTGWVLLVAAAVAVVALISAGLALGRSEEDSTVVGVPDIPAGTVAPVGFADPGAAGFDLRGAFAGDVASQYTAADFGLDHPATVQGPAGADDPWAGAVVAVTKPFDAQEWRGQIIDLGEEVDAIIPADQRAPAVQWRDGDQVHQLSSTRIDRADLVALAARAAAAGYRDGDTIPGEELLYTGREYDLFPYWANGGARAPEQAGVVYDGRNRSVVYDGRDRPNFAVTVTPGGDARWRAAFALASDTSTIDIGSHHAVVATFGRYDHTTHVYWHGDDDTVVAVHTDGDITELAPVLGLLSPLERSAFRDLVHDQPLPDGPPFTYVPGPVPATGPALATASAPDGPRTYETTLHRATQGYTVQASIVEGQGAAFTEAFTETLDDHAIARMYSGNPNRTVGHGIVGGIVGPGAADLVITDAESGAVIPTPVVATGPIDGTDHVLFVIALDGIPYERPLILTVTTNDGSRLRFRI